MSIFQESKPARVGLPSGPGRIPTASQRLSPPTEASAGQQPDPKYRPQILSASINLGLEARRYQKQIVNCIENLFRCQIHLNAKSTLELNLKLPVPIFCYAGPLFYSLNVTLEQKSN